MRLPVLYILPLLHICDSAAFSASGLANQLLATPICLPDTKSSKCYTVLDLSETAGSGDGAEFADGESWGRTVARGATWNEALSRCKEQTGGSLAPLPSQRVTSQILPRIPRELIWVAGRRDAQRGPWFWVDGQQVQESTVAIIEPPIDEHRTTASCGALTGNDVIAKHCGAWIGQFMCHVPNGTPLMCDDDTCCIDVTSHPGNSHRNSADLDLLLCRHPKRGEYNWYRARNHCLKMGGDLAVLKGDIPDITEHLHSYRSFVWIGLLGRPWRWRVSQLETNPVTYTFWGSPPSDRDDCLAVNMTSSAWMAVSCQRPLRYALCRTVEETASAAASVIVADSTGGDRHIIIGCLTAACMIIVILTAVIIQLCGKLRSNQSKTSTPTGHVNHVTTDEDAANAANNHQMSLKVYENDSELDKEADLVEKFGVPEAYSSLKEKADMGAYDYVTTMDNSAPVYVN